MRTTDSSSVKMGSRLPSIVELRKLSQDCEGKVESSRSSVSWLHFAQMTHHDTITSILQASSTISFMCEIHILLSIMTYVWTGA